LLPHIEIGLGGSALNQEVSLWLTAVLFALTYLGLAFGRVPGLHIDRSGIALVGATLMLITGMVSFRQAIGPESIDYETLALLFGMMVVVAYLRLSRLLERIVHLVLDRIRSPWGLLALVVTLSGILSAFLINDVVCLALTPLVLRLARRLRFDPVPHLLAVATAANIGSSGTITGNPQNIFIGSHSHIPYFRFATRLLPVALLGLVLNFLVIVVVYRHRLRVENRRETTSVTVQPGERRDRQMHRQTLRQLQWKSGIVTMAAVLLFFTGLPLPLIALGAASILLLGRVKPAHVYREIDWSLLVMFTGLFIVVHAFQLHVVSRWGIENWHWLLQRPVAFLSPVSVILSNLVSNVPAVLLLEPLVHAMPGSGQETAWLTLAMSSTLAGNLTLLGSIANLIVVESARRDGMEISFWEYCKVGIPLTIITLAVGVSWLKYVRY
jgi:Na+/H+ antiporter NhaD/arsenite permease-like protein